MSDLDADAILKMTVATLKDNLKEMGLGVAGRKHELRERLLQHLGLIDDGDDDEDEDADIQSNQTVQEFSDERSKRLAHVSSAYFTFRDIEESLSTFDGAATSDVKKWIEQIEENAEIVNWSEIHKFIYAKQLLRGAAKLFVGSQIGLRDWNSLKLALANEFGSKPSPADVHKILGKRYKKHSESYREYLYALMEIGKSICLDEESLLEYFIDGVPGSKFSKSVLYQAKTVSELKEQLVIYEKIRQDPKADKPKSMEVHNKTKQETSSSSAPSKNEKRCFKCGEYSHLAKDCPHKQFKCFKCQQMGHRSFECQAAMGSRTKREAGHVNSIGEVSSPKLKLKKVTIRNIEIQALIDTGCSLCLMRCDTFNRLGKSLKLTPEQRQLFGIGAAKISTMGSFEIEVQLDQSIVKLTFHVVQTNDISYEIILGTSIFKHFDILVRDDGVEFKDKANMQVSDDASEDIVQASPRDDGLSNVFSCFNIDGEEQDYDLSHLNKNCASEVKHMIEHYTPKKDDNPPVNMKIILSDEVPVYQPPRRVSYEEQQIIDKQVTQWLDEDIIRPSCSAYASPVVLVSKKNGTKRLCCDYRRLNQKIIRDNFPMTLIDDALERLREANVFTTLDLANGFLHVPVDESSRKYTAFVTHSGQFEFQYVPFGICNSPAVFCRYIHAILKDYIRDGTVVAYMDDLVIPAKTEKEGLEKLEKVLQLAADKGLRIKWGKCQFLRKKIQFLGYTVEKGTISPREEKTRAVKNFPVPQTKKALQRFLDLMSYFRRFIGNYALIAKPLSDMLKKDAEFRMGDEHLIVVQQLKSALIKAPALAMFNPKALTEIHTDASMFGYGGILLQKDSESQQFHPVQFMSRKTTSTEQKYHSYELEVLAIVEALKKWRVYVLGTQFKIVTDCNAFTMTLQKRDVPLRVARWAMYLQEYNYTIEHRRGTQMRHVDALSRISCMMMEDSLKHRLREAQMKDVWTKAVRKILEASSHDDFYIHNDILYKDPTRQLIVVPSQMEREIIEIAHRQGHFSVKKTKDLVEKDFYVPRLETKVAETVNSCIACILVNSKTGKKDGLLVPIDKEDKPLLTFHIDHVGPLTMTRKLYNYILVIVDAFSKFVWLYPTKDTGAVAVIDRLTKQEATFGNPKRIVTDRGSAFTSHAFEDYCKKNQIQHLLIATGVPRGNGQVERIHRIVIPMLAKLSEDNPDQWYRHIGKVQQYINNSAPRSTKIAPFKLLTGCDMRLAESPRLDEIMESEAIESLESDRNETRRLARQNISAIQEENRRSYNRKRKEDVNYNVNDLVAIKRTQFGTNLKLKRKYLGPYKIIEKLPHGRYKVQKLDEVEGPNLTSTAAEYIKPWRPEFGSNPESGRPNVGVTDGRKTTRSGLTF